MPKAKKTEDPDNPIWTKEMFTRAVPFRERYPNLDLTKVTVSELSEADMLKVRTATMRQRAELETITLQLPADVTAALRATGPGWNKLAADILRDGLGRSQKLAQ